MKNDYNNIEKMIKSRFKKLESYKILKNKAFLYIVFFISLINILDYLFNSNYRALLLFVLISIVFYCFTKNMIIILGLATLITCIINYMQSSNIYNKYYSTPFIEPYKGGRVELAMEAPRIGPNEGEKFREGYTSTTDICGNTLVIEGKQNIKKKPSKKSGSKKSGSKKSGSTSKKRIY